MGDVVSKRVNKSITQIEIDKIRDALLALVERVEAIPVRQKQPTLIIKKQDRINYVLNGACDFYETTQELLLKRYRSPKYANRKRILVKVMRDIADVNFDEISEALGFSKQSGIWQMYSDVTEDLQKDSYGNKELKKEYNELLSYLNL